MSHGVWGRRGYISEARSAVDEGLGEDEDDVVGPEMSSRTGVGTRRWK